MPSITSDPPNYVADELDALRLALSAPVSEGGVPSRREDSLLIATWNVRAFGGYTDKWRSGSGDSPTRDVRSVLFIAEIMSRFDVVAVQEVRAETAALQLMLEYLNRDEPDRWRVLATDVTRGSAGNNERLAFVYDSSRVKPSGLAAELVLPDTDGIDTGAADRQFARTPYAVSFEVGSGEVLILTTLHVLWGDVAADREPELRAIADWLDDWVNDEHVWDSDIVALGDFNIDRIGDPRYQAFISTGLHIPPELHPFPRTIFEGGNEKHYDQVAWFNDDAHGPGLSFRYDHVAGYFDFEPLLLDGLTSNSKSWRISDHYPLWVEFESP